MSLSAPLSSKWQTRLLGLFCSVFAHDPGAKAQEFPQVHVSTVPPQLEGVWLASPIVAIGNVDHVVSYGNQTADYIPSAGSPDVHELFWCQGDFHLLAVVKGSLQGAVRKYLWANTAPGCRPMDDNPAFVYHRLKTKFWYLRDDGTFLRPTFDYNAHLFDGVFAAWSSGSPLPPRQRLGSLLLTPLANSDSLDQYARYLWNIGDTACELLGRAACIRQIRDLETLGNVALRDSVCSFLEFQ